jgi:uncharacterized repeat protein (TIGR03803 family)
MLFAGQIRWHSKAQNVRRVVATALCVIALASCSGVADPPARFAQAGNTSLNQPSSQSKRYGVIFNFGSNVDGYYGAYPTAGLINVNGTLYGTTEYGGSYGKSDYVGYGAVYSITPPGVENVLYSFSGGDDGAFPVGGLIDINGTLYGTTSSGGAQGYGTVFGVGVDGKSFRVLHAFGDGGGDGARPMAGLVAFKGKLYGTTSEGGSYGESNYSGGTVFSLDILTGKERVLHSFGAAGDGRYPLADLLRIGNTLYGTTYQGGLGTGVVFSATLTGRETVLHSFGTDYDGRDPAAGLIRVKDALFGTTQEGGAYAFDGGTVFSIDIDGANERVLHSFGNESDGTQPKASLVIVKGNLYGTTSQGGAHNCGTVFRVGKSGDNERILHSFCQSYDDGGYPLAPLVSVNGALYGTTNEGGTRLPSCPHSANICDYGTVFSLKL